MSHYKHKSVQELIDNFVDSGLSAREYVEACVETGDLSAAEAIKLLSVLRDAQSVTFKLAEVDDDSFSGLQMILVRKEEEDSPDCTPLFSIEIDESLNRHRNEVIDILQSFAQELAVLAIHSDRTYGEIISTDDHLEEWLSHPNLLPASDTRH